jgi:NHLM bacteriocin system ABC transporter ATP-binding protein
MPSSSAWSDAPVVAAGGNAPLGLHAGGAWQVEEGQVEVFADLAGPEAARLHVATVAAGGILLGAGERDGVSLLAIGARDTRLRELGAAGLERALADPAGAAELAPLLDGWLASLLSRVRGGAPKAFQEIRPDEELLLAEAGVAARPGEGVVWVRPLAGACRLLGEDELTVRAGELLPLPEVGWVVAAGETRLAAASTLELLRRGEAWRDGLARFHAFLLTYVRREIGRGQGEERVRLTRKAALDRGMLGSSLVRLASVLTRVPQEIEPDEAAEPLLAACRLVGERIGLSFRPPVEMTGGRRQGDRLAAICAASRARYRRVILRADWWRRDNGPLVAFRVLDEEKKTRRAVALIPRSPRRYELVDPVERTRTPVDAAVAEGLSGEAFMFYPRLPDRPLKAIDLLRVALRGGRLDLTEIALMGVAGGLLAMLVPMITGQVFGTVIPGANRLQLGPMVLALMLGALSSAVFQITRSIAVLRLGGKMDGAVQAAVWSRLLELPAAFFRRYPVGDLTGRSMGVDAIRELLTGNVITSVLAAIFSLFSFFLLFYYSWRLALLATALVAVLMVVTLGLVWLQLRHQRELYQLQGKVSSLLFGMIGGIGKLRVSGAEPRAFALWAERFTEQRRRTIQAQRVANVQTTFNSFYGVVTTLALFAMMGFASQQSSLDLGDFLAFNAAFGQFLAAALSMIGVFSSLLSMVPIYERLLPILLELPEVDGSKAEAGELTGVIELSHVSFRYGEEGTLILDDVSFRAAPGEFIALVGPSGAGKSTCLRLILGFEAPSSGSIYFDGQDLTSLSLQSVRRQLGVVLQTGRPMVGDLYTAIVGNSNLGLEDAWEAARMAGLEEDIKAMPMGMHTLISEGGETFSGGQKQRLLIARAIVHRPRIILFDEATSALDNRTQEIVGRSLERLKATRVVIAHRLSTIVNADRIYVMQAGRVVEVGTYEELLRRGGAFAQLAARQIA